MNQLLAHRSDLKERAAVSIILQLLLVVLLRQGCQNPVIFNAGILSISFLAALPVAFLPRWMSSSHQFFLRLLSLFPFEVFLATILHCLGISDFWFGWIVRLVQF